MARIRAEGLGAVVRFFAGLEDLECFTEEFAAEGGWCEGGGGPVNDGESGGCLDLGYLLRRAPSRPL